MYTVKEKGEKPDRKSYSLPYGLRNQYRNHKSETSEPEIMPRNLNELARSWIRLLGSIPATSDTVESEGRQMKQCWIKYIKST